MMQVINHRWNVNIAEAKKIQIELQRKINLTDKYKSLDEIKTVAGCDISFIDNKIIAAFVILKFPELKLIDKLVIRNYSEDIFPYIPTYLSFREGPFIVELLSSVGVGLPTECHSRESGNLTGRPSSLMLPDVVIFDGQGIAHPRRVGIATHIGIIFDIVTIGCAKNVLYGNYDEPPPGVKGAYTYLKDDSGDMIGICLRTKRNVKPVFVSPGHKIGIELSGDVILACCRKYRLPEPLRIAHQLTKSTN